jgi:hypothetical protein
MFQFATTAKRFENFWRQRHSPESQIGKFYP